MIYLLFHLTHLLFHLGLIAFDDFKLVYGLCPQNNDLYDCTFDDVSCNLQLSNPFAYPNWALSRGKISDHTMQTKDGSFYGVDYSSSQVSTGKTVEVNTKYFPPTKGSCVTFWYLMKAIDNQTLRLGIQKDNEASPKYIWYVTKQQGPFWYVHKETVVSRQNWRVFLQASGQGTKGIIGIDDITIDFTKPCKGTAGKSHY